MKILKPISILFLFIFSLNPLFLLEAKTSAKVIVTLDKEFYLSGEIVWYKAFIINQTDEFKNDGFTLEIYNKSGEKIINQKGPVKNNATHGSFILPIELETGEYTIHAYINSSSKSYAYINSIMVYNDLEKNEDINPSTPSVHFSLDRSQLISNQKNTIKILIKNYKKNKVAVLDETNELITSVSPNKLGLAEMTITPELNHSYKLSYNNIEEQLPEVIESDFEVINESDTDFINLLVLNSNTPDETVKVELNNLFDPVYDVSKLSNYTKVLTNGENFILSKKEMKTGLWEIKIESKNKIIYNNKFIIRNEKYLNIDLDVSKKIIEPRQKVQVKVKTNFLGKVNKSNLGIRVIHEYLYKLQSNLSPTNELTLPLSFKSEYYDILNYETSNKEIDFLLLFVDMDSSQMHEKAVLTGSSNFKGRILETSTKVSLESPIISLFDYGTNEIILAKVKNGKIYSQLDEFYGVKNFQIQNWEYKDSPTKISYLKELEKNSFTNIQKNNKIYNKERLKYVLSQKLKQKIQFSFEPVVNFKMNDTILSDHKLLSSKFIIDDYIYVESIGTFLKYIEGLKVKKNNIKERSIFLFSRRRKEYFSKKAQIIINGRVYMGNHENLIKLPCNDIIEISVYKTKEELEPFMPLFGRAGVVDIKAKTQIFKKLKEEDFSEIITVEGFTKVPTPNFPVYDTSEKFNHRSPDFRDILYWNPEVITDENGEAIIEFYTSDDIGKYKIIVEGMSIENNVLGSETIGFKVEGKPKGF